MWACCMAASGKDSEAIASFEKAVAFRAVAAALTETYMRAIEALARAPRREPAIWRARKRLSADGLDLLPSHPPLGAA